MRSILSQSLGIMTGVKPSPTTAKKARPAIPASQHHQHCFPSFPFQQLQVLFTLFSKFFSSFPHGTCLLSVSYPYLALDGIYHPIRAAIPNNSTHGSVVLLPSLHERGYHPPWRAVPGDFTKTSTITTASPDHNSEDFKSELFPLHSPLLRESWLVSFPPLSYMLKFSG
jgi:hypothetical protein